MKAIEGTHNRPSADSVLQVVQLLTRADMMFAIKVAFISALVSLVIAFIIPSKFASSATFTSTSSKDLPLGALSAARDLADAFGVAGGSGATAPEFFQAVAGLRSVREKILAAGYPYPSESGTQTLSLIDIYDIGAATPERQLEKSIDKLGDNLRVSFDRVTGLVTVRAEAPTADLAAAIVDTTLGYLNAANVANRQAQAREEREFLVSRLGVATDSLRYAERSLVGFLSKNRSYEASPELVFQEAALRRSLEFATQVYAQLAAEVERARMQEVRSTPVLTVLDPAVPAAQRLWPKRKLLVLTGSILGLFAALLIRLIRLSGPFRASRPLAS